MSEEPKTLFCVQTFLSTWTWDMGDVYTTHQEAREARAEWYNEGYVTRIVRMELREIEVVDGGFGEEEIPVVQKGLFA